MGIVRWRDWMPQFVVCLLILLILSASAVAASEGSSFDWVADSILALATLLGVLTTSVVSVIGIRRSGRAEANSAASVVAAVAAGKEAASAKAESVAAKEESIAAKVESIAAKEQSVVTAMEVEKTGKAVNGNLHDMLKLVEKAAKAEGALEEKTAQAELKSAVNEAVAVEQERAGKLIEAAAKANDTASNVLGKPVPVQVVTGTGKDEALRVKPDSDERTK